MPFLKQLKNSLFYHDCWNFFSNEPMINMCFFLLEFVSLILNTCFLQVAAYQDPRDACSAIAAESYKLWLEHENRTDDITIIIVHIRDMENVGAPKF